MQTLYHIFNCFVIFEKGGGTYSTNRSLDTVNPEFLCKEPIGRMGRMGQQPP